MFDKIRLLKRGNIMERNELEVLLNKLHKKIEDIGRAL